MASPDRYASILNTLIEIAKERGTSNPGSDEALLCYDQLEAAITEAEAWGIPIDAIGLAGFDTAQLLSGKVAKEADF